MEKELIPLEQRRRKALLVLPLLVLPFLTMAFWALGGGKGTDKSGNEAEGLNLQLPQASSTAKDKWDKLRFYEDADKDSAEWQRQLRQDRYDAGLRDKPLNKEESGKTGAYAYNPAPYHGGSNNLETERQIYQKIDEINKQLSDTRNDGTDQPGTIKNATDQYSVSEPPTPVYKKNGSLAEHDSELVQLNQMMDKILDIQHPERIKKEIQQRSARERGKAFFVSKEPLKHFIGLLDSTGNTISQSSGFYGLEETSRSDPQNAIEAVVPSTQTLVSGSVVKLRLLNTIYVDGEAIPEGSFVWGKSTLENERLHVSITVIRFRYSLFKVNLRVYDLDGLAGINIPTAFTREVAKTSTDNAIQQLELGTLDPSLRGQATAAGVGAIKSLLSKKARLTKVIVKAGYKVLLRNEE